MKVVLIAFDSGEYTVRLAGALADSAEVHLMLPRSQAVPNARWLSPAVHLHSFDKPRLRQPAAQLRLMRRLIARVHAMAPDVIHFQKSHLWFNLALPLLGRFPLVISAHDPRDHVGDKSSRKTPQLIKDFGYRRATRLIAHSASMVPEISRRLKITPRRIDTIPLLALGDAGEAPDVDELEGRVLFFGRLWRYKGLAHLIRAAPQIQADVPQLRVVIAGRGEAFAPYRALMHDECCFIVHNEWISLEKQARLFREAAVVVLPYTEATQSGVVPVAYNFARPVVASAVGGLLDQVEDGRTGFLVPPGDERALAERVVRLLKDPDLRRQMGQNGRRKLAEEWSPQVVARLTIQAYDRAIAEHGSRRRRAAADGLGLS